MAKRCLLPILLAMLACEPAAAFAPVSSQQVRTGFSTVYSTAEHCERPSRRHFLSNGFAALVTSGISLPARAETVATSSELALDMKAFVDPLDLFKISVPRSFFVLRRSAKGDLPDEKTGKGRRGSSIFTAGDMGKAEVIAVERFPTRVLLEENGIDASGDLSTFPGIGEPAAIANLLVIRRDKEKSVVSNTQILSDSLFLAPDGKELRFKLKTEIDVQKPELLMETYGVSQLFRITTAKASLRSNDGQMLVVFASALEQDYMGPDGVALQEAVDSFEVTDRSS